MKPRNNSLAVFRYQKLHKYEVIFYLSITYSPLIIMTSLHTLIYAPRSIALMANGVFTGLGLSMNFVSVPAIKASKDPLPSFVTTYNNAAKIAIISILTGTISHGICYYKTKQNKYLYASLLSFFSMPFTILAIAPVNNQLFALQKLGDDYDRQKVHALINKWNTLQAFRTITGAAAFAITVLYT